MHETVLLKCCPEYEINDNKTECKPICSPFCVSGNCTEPNVCQLCQKGYIGPTCISEYDNKNGKVFIFLD